MDSLETITFVGSLYIVVYLFLFFPMQVQGASMEPTLHTGDRLIVNRVIYKVRQPERGDVVIIKSPQNPDIDFVKRVIGLPGDNVLLKNGEVYINNVLLPEPFVADKTFAWEDKPIIEDLPFVVPKDEIIVMGDNRPRSSDSREFGPIPISSIVGEAILRYFPPDKFGWFTNPIPTSLR